MLIFRTLGLQAYWAPEGEGGVAGAGGDPAGGDAGKAGGDAAAAAAAAAASGGESKAAAFDWGAFADGLKDDTHKTYAKNFKGPEDLLTGALNLRKEISARIKVPGKDAAPEDVAAFRKAIGAREKPEEYKAALPEGYEMGDVDNALLGAMQKAAADTGVPAASFEGFTKTYFDFAKQVQAKVAEEVAAFQRDGTAKVKQEFGADFEKLVNVAETFVSQRLNVPEFVDLLNDTVQWNGVSIQLRSHPAVVKALAQIGLRTAEDGIINSADAGRVTSLKEEIAALEKAHPLGQRTRDQDEKIRALYQKLYG